MKNSPFIILADDDADDVFFLKEAFALLSSIPIQDYSNGQALLDALLTNPTPTNPCLIVLDINMPAMNGIEVLQQIKAQHSLHHVPIVVFATGFTSTEKEICNRFKVEAIKKPRNCNGWAEVAKRIALLCSTTS